MNIYVEDLEMAIRTIRLHKYELTSEIAARVAKSAKTMGLLLSECRQRGLITSREGSKGYFEHIVQYPGRQFLEWMDHGRAAGHLP